MAITYIEGSDGAWLLLGLSTDTKPVAPPADYTFLETDTAMMYDVQVGAWTFIGLFNGNSQLVQTAVDGKLPALDRSNLTGPVTATLVNGMTITTTTGTFTLTNAKTFTVLKTISFTSPDDTSVITLPAGTKTLLATDGSAASLTSFPTLNQNTTGSGASLSISGQSALLTFTGLESTNRVKTVRDAADTILELGGSYTPTGTWTSLTLVTPTIGVATGTSLSVAGLLKSSSSSAGVGYATGAGGTITQQTNKSTGVTIDTICGAITMNGAALAATTSVSFTVTNSSVAATDTVVVNIASAATNNTYLLLVDAVAAGSFRIHLYNKSGSSRSEALVLNFAVIKGVTS